MGQEYLGHVTTVFSEMFFVGLYQPALADRCGGLLEGNLPGTLFQPQPRHAGGNGAGGDHHHLPSFGREGRDLGGEPGKPLLVQATLFGGKDGAADLEDYKARLFDKVMPQSKGVLHEVSAIPPLPLSYTQPVDRPPCLWPRKS